MNVLEKIEQQRKKCPYLIYGGAILVAIAFIFTLVFLFTNNGVILGFLIAFLIIGLTIFFVGYGILNNIQRQFKDYIVKAVQKDILPNAIYQENQGVALDDVYKSGLLQVADRSKSKNLMLGTYNNIDFKTCNLYLEERRLHTDKKGNRSVSYVPYFDGKVLIFDFNKTFKSNIIITEASLLEGFYSMKKINYSNDHFNKKYKIYSEDEEFTNLVLNDSIVEALLELDKHNPDSLMISINNTKLYIAINNIDRNLDKVDLNKEINFGVIEYIKKRMDIISYIVSFITENDQLFD